MDRTEVNPWEWSKAFGFSQAVAVDGAQRLLLCSGQTALDPNGTPPATADMREQVTTAMTNLEAVLAAAGMTIANVVRLTVFTTDVDELLPCFQTVTGAFAPDQPAVTLIGVTRLAYPELKVEIEATAAR
jgi:enamine deaminase RidA (YjgF/YER057c/UK114 family)